MSQCAEFHIIGCIGKIKKVGATLRVTLAANYSYKDDRGDWAEKTRWNEITIFNEVRQGYVHRNLKPGDLVRATASSSRPAGRRTAKHSTASPWLASRSAGSPKVQTTPTATKTTSSPDERLGRRKPPLVLSFKPTEARMIDFSKARQVVARYAKKQ